MIKEIQININKSAAKNKVVVNNSKVCVHFKALSLVNTDLNPLIIGPICTV